MLLLETLLLAVFLMLDVLLFYIFFETILYLFLCNILARNESRWKYVMHFYFLLKKKQDEFDLDKIKTKSIYFIQNVI